MTAPDLPDSWDEDPWPLDDPLGSPLRPRNWSDTHGPDVPQAADLADEAWQYAVDNGMSLERALVELQRREVWRAEMSGTIPGGLSAGGVAIGGGPAFHVASPPFVWSEPERDGDDVAVTFTVPGTWSAPPMPRPDPWPTMPSARALCDLYGIPPEIVGLDPDPEPGDDTP